MAKNEIAFAELIERDLKTSQRSQDDQLRDAVMAELDKLGGQRVQEDAIIFEGTRFVAPAHMEGNIDGIVRFFRNYQEQMETTYEFTRVFNYRPYDGANAFQVAMKKLFGSTGFGKSISTFFGPIKPEFKTINCGPGQTMQVPWNRVAFPPLEADFYLGMTRHSELGQVFALNVTAPRKHRARIDAFFQVMEEVLKTGSIYKGKAFTEGLDPEFFDTTTVDRSAVVYTDVVNDQLEANLWGPLDYAQQMRQAGLPLKRQILIEGPYGTGKSLAGKITAQVAVNNGWTFVMAKPGQQDVNEILKTARLYAPAVVWFEDIDVVAQQQTGRENAFSQLLDTLDGITNKDIDVVAGFTTNHAAQLPKGVLRAGRIDAVIHIGKQDRPALERLIKATVQPELLGNVDYDEACKALDGLLPAFAKEALNHAVRYAIVRNGGQSAPISTSDIVAAAEGLKHQRTLMEDANEAVGPESVDASVAALVEQTVTKALNKTRFVDNDEDEQAHYKLRVVDGEARSA